MCCNCRVHRLSLAGNRLQGNLSQLNWTNADQLQSVNLSSNLLTGSLPDSWSQLSGFVSIDVSRNKLTGTLPQAWGTAGLQGLPMQLSLLDASFNALIGGALTWGVMQCALDCRSSSYCAACGCHHQTAAGSFDTGCARDSRSVLKML